MDRLPFERSFERKRKDLEAQRMGALRRLHEEGKMHNRMICPICREARLHPRRVSTSKPWKQS